MNEPQQKKSITIKDAIMQLESVRESTVISYFADPKGVIELQDCLVLDDNLNSIKPQNGKIKRLDLVLNSYGGFIDAAYKYVRICREYAEEFNVIVPLVAKSAATGICLGADKIIMTAISELGPLDPMIQHPFQPKVQVPARSIRDYFEFLKKTGVEEVSEKIKMHISRTLDPYLIGSYEGALKSAQQIAEMLLQQYHLKEAVPHKSKEIAQKLTEYFYSHSFVIDRKLAEDLGLKIERAEDNSMLIGAIKLLTSIYSQYMHTNRIIKLQGTRDINRIVQEK